MAFAVDAGLAATPTARASVGGIATVAFLGIAAGVQMSDRGVHALLSGQIKANFGVGDAVIGMLHGVAGILVASALAIPLAKLADRYSRKAILLALIAAWSGLTALGALAPNFPLFFAGRAASGVTEFAMIPVVYSLIPDLVPDRWRVAANLGFAALMAIGASIGFYLGNDLLTFATVVAPLGLPGWRATLLLLSVAGLPLLILGLAIVDPAREHSHGKVAAESGSLADFVRTNTRTALLFLGAAGGLAVAVQAAQPMAAMALSRRFSTDLGHIGHALGDITLVTALASLPIAGLVDRSLRGRWAARARPLIMALAAALAIPLIAMLGTAPDQHHALVLLGGFTLLTCVGNALIPTMLQDLSPPELRARCFAAYSFVIAAFCALGPVLAGAISDYVVSDNLLLAISLAAVPPLIAASLSALFSARMQQR